MALPVATATNQGPPLQPAVVLTGRDVCFLCDRPKAEFCRCCSMSLCDDCAKNCDECGNVACMNCRRFEKCCPPTPLSVCHGNAEYHCKLICEVFRYVKHVCLPRPCLVATRRMAGNPMARIVQKTAQRLAVDHLQLQCG